MSDLVMTTHHSERILRLLSYNVQVGIRTQRPRHYVTGSWKHVLPCARRMENLDAIARRLAHFDIVGLQEVDAGSLRSNFINMAEYLAERAGFPFWYHQVNRNLGRLAKHSNALLSHYRPDVVEDLRLPGLIPGRQALLAGFHGGSEPLAVIVVHLALSRRARLQQLDDIANVVNRYPHAIVMGDMNTYCGSPEMRRLFRRTRLMEPVDDLCTFPSWRPMHSIDHILVTETLRVRRAETLAQPISDHLPIMTEVELPETVSLTRLAPPEVPDFDQFMHRVKA